MRRAMLVLLCLPLIAVVILIAGTTVVAQTPQKVRVYLIDPPSTAFVDENSKTLTQARKELLGKLKGDKKPFELVSTADTADVTLDLKSVAIVDGPTQTRAIGGTLKSEAQKQYQGVLTLHAGDYTTDFTKQNLFTSMIVAQFASDVEKWIQENRERLLAARHH